MSQQQIVSGQVADPTSDATVHNGTGGTLLKGTAVQLTGASAGIPAISALTPSVNPASVGWAFMGVLTEDISNGASGNSRRAGIVTGLDTSGFSAGDPVMAGTAGALASSPFPNFQHGIGHVLVSDATVGSIEVAFQDYSVPTHGHDPNVVSDGGGLSGPVMYEPYLQDFFEVIEHAAPGDPPAGEQYVWIDSTTHHLMRKEHGGAPVDIG